MRKIVPAALGVYLAATGAVQSQEGRTPQPVEPGQLALQSVSANQRLATTIAGRLRTNANLKNYRVDVSVTEGLAELRGQVTDAGQRDEVVRTVQAISGVERVRDKLTILDAPGVVSVQSAPSQVAPVQAAIQPIGPAVGAAPPEPLPIFTAQPGAMPNPQLQPPPLPPNAWPTYAPYNNVSRVAYPNNYPYEAWPFIGPMYPFPKVPLGWRAVTLRWQDGHWWYGREASGHDWWRIRYW